MSTYENQTGRLTPQSRLQQRYVIIGQAGRGGMGAVYQALDTQASGRQVAIKEMSQAHLDHTQIADATAQFQREAAMLHSLSHPNLPRVYDAFNAQHRSYLVMDFINGKTLMQQMKELNGQPLPVVQVLKYALQLCNVLTYLHGQQPPIIFRDLKPTNVMVTADGHVFLIDFGIARLFKEGQQQDTVFLGSPGYAPPEQHGTSQTNPRSDLYSLGATLHYCLTGKDPYQANYRFAFPPVRRFNPQVPVELDQMVARLLSPNEQQRPASAMEVQQVLTRIMQQSAEYTSALSAPAPSTPSGLPATQYMVPASASNSASQQHEAPYQSPTIAIQPSQSQVQPATRPTPGLRTTYPSSIWTLRFIAIFALFLVATIGFSLFAFNAIDNSDHVVEAGLSLVALLTTLVGSGMVKNGLARTILLLTGLASLIVGVLFATQALLSQTIVASAILPFDTTNLLFTVGLIGASIVSLLWLIRPFNSMNRIIAGGITGIALICAIAQFSHGDFEDIKHFLLLVALIALIQGVLVAIQAERVQERRG